MRAATAAVVRRPGAFEIEQVEIDAPPEARVLVRIVGCGLCHTDLSARDQEFPFKLPAILGHEGSGIVEQVGAGVTRLRPGDAVVLSYAFCGDCEYCQDDRMAYCTRNARLNFSGVRADGSALAKIGKVSRSRLASSGRVPSAPMRSCSRRTPFACPPMCRWS